MSHIFNWWNFAGWGNLVHVDTKEYKITDGEILLVSIPKLAGQWKIIHDFKPTDYPQSPSYPPISLSLKTSSGDYFLGVLFPHPYIGLELLAVGEDSVSDCFKSDQLPKVGEWTRIEISHEEEDGKHFISLTVGGKESLREEVDDFELSEIDGIRVLIGQDHDEPYQPGFIRGLVVLEKQ